MVSGLINVSLNWGTLTVELFFNSEKRRMSEQVPPSCKMKKSRIFSAELGLCDPRGASYAPLRILSKYRHSAVRLEARSDNRIMCSKRLKPIVFTGIPLGSWQPMVSGLSNVFLHCGTLTVELFLTEKYDGCRNKSANLQDEKIEDFFRRAGALRSQESILRSAADAKQLPVIRWEVGGQLRQKNYV